MAVAGTALNAPAADPSTSETPLELWYTTFDSTTHWDIRVATRASADAPFDSGAAFPFNSVMDEHDPTLSADGLVLDFGSNRVTATSVYEVARATINDPFASPRLVAPMLAEGAVDGGIDLSADGLRLYVADYTGDLRMVERASRSDVFGAPGPVLASGVFRPSVSPDELELYYEERVSSGGLIGLSHRTRTTTTIAFPAIGDPIAAQVGNPDVSTDSTRLYVASAAYIISVFTRTCN